MRSVLVAIAGGIWLLIALPLWWASVAFGSPLIPRPVGQMDVIEAVFLLSFYVPLIVLGAIIFRTVRSRP